jgi:hypothetical protein
VPALQEAKKGQVQEEATRRDGLLKWDMSEWTLHRGAATMRRPAR